MAGPTVANHSGTKRQRKITENDRLFTIFTDF